MLISLNGFCSATTLFARIAAERRKDRISATLLLLKFEANVSNSEREAKDREFLTSFSPYKRRITSKSIVQNEVNTPE